MDVMDYMRIRKCHSSLVTRMDVREHFLSHLYQDGVIGDTIMEEVLSKPPLAPRAMAILQRMPKTDCNGKSPFPSLLKALRACGQEFLANYLESCVITVDDVTLFKDDLGAFLRPGETVESLVECITNENDQTSKKALGTRQSWPPYSGARPKVPFNRSKSDQAVQCPSTIAESHSAPSLRSISTYVEPEEGTSDRDIDSSSAYPSSSDSGVLISSLRTEDSTYESLQSDTWLSDSTYSSLAPSSDEYINDNSPRTLEREQYYTDLPERKTELKFPTVNAVFLEQKTS